MPATKRPVPSSSASTAIADPGPPIIDTTAPTITADTSSINNVLTIFVPADHTRLDMGTGDASGFRVKTDRHVDMVALHPNTAIALGQNLGPGLVDGLSIFSEGEKKEIIQKAVQIGYGATLDETVEKAVTETYKDKKDESIKGPLTVKVTGGNASYDFSKKLDITSGERTETVNGDWKAHVTGELKWDVDGPSEIKGKGKTTWLWRGDKAESTFGATVGLFGGNKNEITIGAISDTKLALVLETCVAVKMETNKGPRFTSSPTVEKGKRGLHIENETLAKKEAEATIENIKQKLESHTLLLQDVIQLVIK